MSRLSRTAAVVGLVTLLAACSGGTREAGAPMVREAQTAACPGLTDEIDESLTFTWMYSVDNTSFDKDRITTNNSLMYLFPIYDSLTYVNPAGEPEPMLAQSWDVSEDGKVLTMKLIEDWTYHDGVPFDAASVVANVERSRAPGSFSENALRMVTGVEAVDELTVRFTTDGGAGALAGVLGGAGGMMMSPAVMDDPSQEVRPTGGSGAYRITNYVSGSRVEYAAVENYWAPDAQNVANMVFLISGDDNARLNAVTTGAADTTFLRATMYEAAAAQSNVVICEQPSLSAYGLNLNTARSEFGKKEVRQALNHAIDREAVSVITNGFLVPGTQMFPEWYFAANPQFDGSYYPYDPEKAQSLLAEAGLPDGFSFELQVVNLALYQQIAEVVQANLAQVGISMTITPVELGTANENFAVNKSVDAVLFEQKAEVDPSIAVASHLLPNGFYNPGDWGTDEITGLAARAANGADSETRSPAYDELFSAVVEEVGPTIMIGHLTTPFVLNEQTKGVEIYGDGARNFRGVGVEPKN